MSVRIFVAMLVCAFLAAVPTVKALATEDAEVEPRIVEDLGLTLVGAVDTAAEVAELEIAATWQRFAEMGDIDNAVEGRGYELHIALEGDPGVRCCLCGVEVTEVGELPLGAFVKVLPPVSYAVFTHRVADGYAAVYERINAWLASSAYEEAATYDFQLYDARFTSMDDPESLQEIYVPVKVAEAAE